MIFKETITSEVFFLIQTDFDKISPKFEWVMISCSHDCRVTRFLSFLLRENIRANHLRRIKFRVAAEKFL